MTVCDACVDFMIGQVTPKAFASIGWKYYIIFCIFSFTNAIAMWALIPEVVGRPLEQLDELLKNEPCEFSPQISGSTRFADTCCAGTDSIGFIPRSAALRKKVKGTDVEDRIRNGEHEAPAVKVMDEDKKEETTFHEHS